MSKAKKPSLVEAIRVKSGTGTYAHELRMFLSSTAVTAFDALTLVKLLLEHGKDMSDQELGTLTHDLLKEFCLMNRESLNG